MKIIKEGQTTKEMENTMTQKKRGQRDKQRSTFSTSHKTKDRATRTPLKIESEFGGSRRVSSSCTTKGTLCVILDTNAVISHE